MVPCGIPFVSWCFYGECFIIPGKKTVAWLDDRSHAGSAGGTPFFYACGMAFAADRDL